MPTEQYANSAQTVLNGGINSSTTTIVVASNSGFPSAPQFRILVDNELMLVTAIGGSGNLTWTVTRAVEGPNPAAIHSSGAAVTQVLTAAALLSIPASGAISYTLSPGGRLTLSSGTAVTTSDVTAATALYYTPYLHDQISIYSGTTWTQVTFSEQSLLLTDAAQTGTWSSSAKTITGLTNTSQLVRGMQVTGTNIAANSTIASIDSATQVTLNNTPTGAGSAAAVTFKVPPNTNYDIFGVLVSGVLKVQFGNAWSGNTTRADALGTQNGVQVNNTVINSGDSNSIPAKQGRYLGTIRSTATAGQGEDSFGGSNQAGGHRYIWNMYNRILRPIAVIDSGGGHTQNSTWRQYDGVAGNKVEYVCGLSLDPVTAEAYSSTQSSSTNWFVAVGVGVDSTSTNSATIGGTYSSITPQICSQVCYYSGYPGLGYHALNWLEYSQPGAGAMTWLGSPASGINVGMRASVFG